MTRLFNLKIVSLLFARAIYMLYLWCKQKGKNMETIISNTEYKVTFNGSATYYFEDLNGNCYKTFSTERKAINHFNKVSKLTNAK